MTDPEKAKAEFVQAQADYLANVPGAWERYQYWRHEFVRLSAVGEAEKKS